MINIFYLYTIAYIVNILYNIFAKKSTRTEVDITNPNALLKATLKCIPIIILFLIETAWEIKGLFMPEKALFLGIIILTAFQFYLAFATKNDLAKTYLIIGSGQIILCLLILFNHYYLNV